MKLKNTQKYRYVRDDSVTGDKNIVLIPHFYKCLYSLIWYMIQEILTSLLKVSFARETDDLDAFDWKKH